MLTVEIKQINFTDTLHALATAACRHAEQRDGAIANQLLAIAADLNAVGKDIESEGLADILNSQLPSSISAIETATGNQRIIALLKDNPDGLTGEAIADALDLAEATIREYTALLFNQGKIHRTGRPPYTYFLPEDNDTIGDANNRTNGSAPQSPITNHQSPAVGTLAARIIEYITQHPGSTSQQIAAGIGVHYVTVLKETATMKTKNQIYPHGQRPIKYFPIRPTPPTAQAADTTSVPAVPT
jgi:hypothetical protein